MVSDIAAQLTASATTAWQSCKLPARTVSFLIPPAHPPRRRCDRISAFQAVATASAASYFTPPSPEITRPASVIFCQVSYQAPPHNPSLAGTPVCSSTITFDARDSPRCASVRFATAACPRRSLRSSQRAMRVRAQDADTDSSTTVCVGLPQQKDTLRVTSRPVVHSRLPSSQHDATPLRAMTAWSHNHGAIDCTNRTPVCVVVILDNCLLAHVLTFDVRM